MQTWAQPSNHFKLNQLALTYNNLIIGKKKKKKKRNEENIYNLLNGMQLTQTADARQSIFQTRVQNPDEILYVNMEEVWQNDTRT